MSFARPQFLGIRFIRALPHVRPYKLGHYQKAINLTHLYLGDKILIELA